jgi:hypothetical protein
MILLNYSHPLSPAQLAQVEALSGQKIERLIEIHTQIDPQQPLAPQVTALADKTQLTPLEWQSAPLLINPPSLNFVAVVLLAELHGRCGYFPAILRLRPVPNSLPPQFEAAEIINLQAVRDSARTRRPWPSSNTSS